MANTVTMTDVALEAGVSVSTVSRVLNGSLLISAVTRDRTLAAAKRLSYTLDPVRQRVSRRLRQGTRTIGFMVDATMHRQAVNTGSFYERMLFALQDALHRRDYAMLFGRLDDLDGNGSARDLAEGIITETTDIAKLRSLATRLPTVLFNVGFEGIPLVDTVIPDVATAARQQLEYLTGLGHRSIACFRPRLRHWEPIHGTLVRGYWQGYEAACQQFDLPLPAAWLAPVEFGKNEDETAIAAWLDRVLGSQPHPTAIVTYDIYAGELIRQLEDRGLRVPREVSIMGYDDHTFGRPCPLALSTWRQDFPAMAETAVELLLSRRAEPARRVRTVLVPGELILRASTTAPPSFSSAPPPPKPSQAQNRRTAKAPPPPPSHPKRKTGGPQNAIP